MEEVKNIISEVLNYDNTCSAELLNKAFEFAKKAHEGQKRDSGEEYITHPIEVAKILVEFKADCNTICAAFLHDVVEQGGFDLKHVEKKFGKEIATLVEGVTKTSRISFETREERTAEHLRKLLLATTHDIRIVLIKLADRLHNMRTLKFTDPIKQQRIARETLDIYAPIAYKLGMYSLKGELEDLCLKYLNPGAYANLKKKMGDKRAEREKKAETLINALKEKLNEEKIETLDISGRAKYFYSIYKKMIRDNKSFDEIYDLIALRVIVKDISDCYKVIALVHQLWKPIPGRFKDYIAVPKSNGYQSLHTDVVTPYGVLEVQVRTKDMDNIAKYGIAAHWRYKGTERDKLFDKRVEWMEQILEWKRKTPHEFLSTLKVELFQDEIVVFTPKGDPIILPENATPIDFAYAVHSGIGDHCSKANVNGVMVALDTPLKGGDIINIITGNKVCANRSWLGIVKTNKAKQKIRNALGIEGEDKSPRKNDENIDITKYLSHSEKGNLKIAKCCTPKFQEEVVAFKTKDGAITIHRKNCSNVNTIDAKKIEIKWDVPDKFVKNLYVYVNDEYGLIEKILNTLMHMKVSVLSINIRPHKASTVIIMQVNVKDDETFERAIKSIEKIPNVTSTRHQGNI